MHSAITEDFAGPAEKDAGPAARARISWRLRAAIVIMVAVGAAAFFHECVYFSFPYKFTDFSVYYASAQAAADGLNPFQRDAVAAELARMQISFGMQEYLYPSVFLVFLQPLIRVSLPVAHKLFLLCSYAALAGSVILLWRSLKNGSAISGLPLWLVLSIILWFTPIWSSLTINQINILVLFFLVACFYLTVSGREFGAGAALGVATMLKIMPGLLLLYFLIRRQWRALAGFAVAIFSLEIVSWFYFGRLLDRFLPQALFDQSSRWASDWLNMSLPSVISRAIGQPGTGILTIAGMAVVTVVGLPTLFALWKYRDAAGPASYLLFSVLVTDFLLFQTVLFMHHEVHLLIPFVVILAVLARPHAGLNPRSRRILLGVLVLSFIMIGADYWRVWLAFDMLNWGWWSHSALWGLLLLWCLQVVLLLSPRLSTRLELVRPAD